MVIRCSCWLSCMLCSYHSRTPDLPFAVSRWLRASATRSRIRSTSDRADRHLHRSAEALTRGGDRIQSLLVVQEVLRARPQQGVQSVDHGI